MNSENTTSEYLLLFQGKDWYNGLSSEELQKVMSQCKAWFEKINDQGKAKGGRALVRSSVSVSGKNARVVSDGPFAESKEAIGGYMILEADSLEEAIAVAKSNPTLAYGTTIEIRPLAEECPMDTRARQLAQSGQLAEAAA